MKQYCVYILSSKSKVLYIGVTSNLKKRIWEHKNKVVEGFTKKYNVDKLVYFEQTENIMSALEREKQLKKWNRNKKIILIESINPDWKDLYDDL
jgi:putative endonuclease